MEAARSWMTYIGNKVLALSPGSTALPARKRLCNGQLWPLGSSQWQQTHFNSKSKISPVPILPADDSRWIWRMAGFGKSSQYTMVRRNSSGKLEAEIPTINFCKKLERASFFTWTGSFSCRWCRPKKLHNSGPKPVSDDYQASDMAWLDMKTNKIDIVMGPIENYEDRLLVYKTSYETFVLIKDMEWKTWKIQFLPTWIAKRTTSRRSIQKKRQAAILN